MISVVNEVEIRNQQNKSDTKSPKIDVKSNIKFGLTLGGIIALTKLITHLYKQHEQNE